MPPLGKDMKAIQAAETLKGWYDGEREAGRGDEAAEHAMGFTCALLINRGFSPEEIGGIASGIAASILKANESLKHGTS